MKLADLPVARGRLVPSRMNRTEQAYADRLELRRHGGEVAWWCFEGLTFKLGPDLRYTPDFPLMLTDGTLEIHECKGGFARDDSKAKFQMAAGKFPFVFRWCVYQGGRWTITTPFAEDR